MRNRNTVKLLVVSMFFMAFSFFLMTSVYLVILYFLYIAFVFFTYSRNGIFDPRKLLLLLIAMYSIWFPLQAIVVGYSYIPIKESVLVETIRLQLFAVSVYVLVVSALVRKESKEVKQSFFIVNKNIGNRTSDKITFWAVLFLTSYALYSILVGGFSSKRELADSELSVALLSQFAFTFLYVILIFNMIRDKGFTQKKIPILIFLVSFLFFIVAGERDIFFKVVLIIYMVSCDKSSFNSNYSSLFVALAAIVLVPISQAFKSVMLSGEISLTNLGLELILSNEFTSSGRNLYSLVYFGVQNSFSYLFNDVIRALIPAMFISDSGINSTANWFNNIYRYNHGFSGSSGWGFSLIGEGYLIGGYFGIMLLITIYASIISFFYNLRFRSIYFYAFYLLLFLVSIYVLRADLANFLSQAFKVSGLAVFAIYLLGRVLKDKNKI